MEKFGWTNGKLIRTDRLMAEQPSDVIIIQADKEAEHGLVVEVMDQIKAAGIDRISIAATAGS
jgi:biopolymer transport protein ExbD